MILKGIFHPRGVFHESGNTVICLAKALIIWWNSVAICYYLDCNYHCHWLEDTSCLCSVLTHAFIFLCCLPHNLFCIITQQDAFKPEFSKTHFFHMGFNTRKNVPIKKSWVAMLMLMHPMVWLTSCVPFTKKEGNHLMSCVDVSEQMWAWSFCVSTLLSHTS